MIGTAALYFLSGVRAVRADLITHTVRYEPLHMTIVERGTLESANNSDVVCRVKARQGANSATTIKWVIDDGTYVTAGQQIVDLDDAGLQDQLKAQKITLDSARALAISAEENYKIVVSQNQSDIQTAQVAIQLTKLDLAKYQRGDYPQSLKDIQGRIETAESDLEMWRDRAAWSERMVKKGYLSASQSVAERSRLRSAEIALSKVGEELRVLEYTRERTETDLRSKLEEAQRALDRVEKQARAKEVQAGTERQSKLSIYDQEKARHQEIEDEIRKTDIFAPQDGLVVYHMTEQSRFGGGSQQSIIAQGEPVREGQKLMRIPDLRNMQVNARVHEALVSRVRGERYASTGFCDSVRGGLLTDPSLFGRLANQFAFAEVRDRFRDREQRLTYGGQPARIRVDAFPNRPINGHVKMVATVASQADMLSSDVKVYQTLVALDETMEGLKPGMSAEVTIAIDKAAENVLTVPVHAIVGSAEMGAQRKCFVLTDEGPQERDIVLGLSNDRMAEVRSGIKEGDRVVMNPKALLSADAKVRQPNAKGRTPEASEGTKPPEAEPAIAPDTTKKRPEGKGKRKGPPKAAEPE